MSTSEETAEEVKITRDMLYYVKDVNWKYKEDLCQHRQEKENERKLLKRKIGNDEIKQIAYSGRIRENTDQKKLRIWTLFRQCLS